MAKKMIEVTTVRESNVVSAGGAPHIMGASFANAGATADAAHYLFSFETERGVNAAELAVKTQKEVNRGTVTEAELFWNTLCAVIVDLCGECGAVTVPRLASFCALTASSAALTLRSVSNENR